MPTIVRTLFIISEILHNFLILIYCRLWRLFNNLEHSSPLRYHVYYHLVQVAKQCDQVREVFSSVDQLKGQFVHCPPSNEQMQKMYRLLHDVLKDTNRWDADFRLFQLKVSYSITLF